MTKHLETNFRCPIMDVVDEVREVELMRDKFEYMRITYRNGQVSEIYQIEPNMVNMPTVRRTSAATWSMEHRDITYVLNIFTNVRWVVVTTPQF
jgi:hypothetical protein